MREFAFKTVFILKYSIKWHSRLGLLNLDLTLLQLFERGLPVPWGSLADWAPEVGAMFRPLPVWGIEVLSSFCSEFEMDLGDAGSSLRPKNSWSLTLYSSSSLSRGSEMAGDLYLLLWLSSGGGSAVMNVFTIWSKQVRSSESIHTVLIDACYPLNLFFSYNISDYS